MKLVNQLIGTFLIFTISSLELKPVLSQINTNNIKFAQAETGICAANLGKAIEAIANRPQYQRGRLGILIETLSSKQVLYSRDRDRYFIPASNTKILTTAAALLKFGSQYRIRTSVYDNGNDIISIVGKGDPSLTNIQLNNLAKQLKNRGIKQINLLIGDDRYFTGSPVNSSWQWEDVQAGYGAPINSLIYNQNSIDLKLSPQGIGKPLKVDWIYPKTAPGWQIENNSITVATSEPEFVEVGREFNKPIIRVSGQLRVGSASEPVYVAVTEPGDRFLQEFQQILINAGIKVNKISLNPEILNSENFPQKQQELAAVESPNIAKLITETNQVSNNLYAESLLRIMGAEIGKNNKNKDTASLGLQVIKDTLNRVGVNSNTYNQADGSGLSRLNAISPEALVQILRIMAFSPEANVWKDSLPVNGISGTLKNRLRNTSDRVIVRAKSGTISGVVALSGYIENPNYETLVFSMIINQSNLSSAMLRQPIDDIIVLLSRLRRC